MFGIGWIPFNIPINSKEITEVHDVSSNKVCAKFRISISDSSGFITTLIEKGFNKVTDTYEDPPKFGIFFYNRCPFDNIDIKNTEPEIFIGESKTLSVTNYVIGRHNTYFALDKSSGTVYYWSLPKRI